MNKIICSHCRSEDLALASDADFGEVCLCIGCGATIALASSERAGGPALSLRAARAPGIVSGAGLGSRRGALLRD